MKCPACGSGNVIDAGDGSMYCRSCGATFHHNAKNKDKEVKK